MKRPPPRRRPQPASLTPGVSVSTSSFASRSGSTPRHALRRTGKHELVAHGHRRVGLVVTPARDQRDGPPRYQLAHKNDGAPPAPVIPAPAYVEPKVDLVEVAVPGHGNAQHARVQEPEADESGEHGPVQVVELGPGRHERPQQRGWHLVVQHGEVLPTGRQKWPQRVHL